MGTRSLRDLLTHTVQELDGRYPGVTTSILFELTDGNAYRLIVDRGQCRLESGSGEAHATASAGEQVLIDLLTGKLDADYALQAGKVQVEGDFRVLTTLAATLSPEEGHHEPLLDPRYPRQTMEDLLLPRDEWHPYPTIDDREGWDVLPQSLRKALISQGETALNADWPVLLAVRYLDYARNGNRSRYQEVRSRRRHMLLSLVIAECVEAQGRLLDEIANGLWLICEESSWCVPAHIGVQRAGVGLPDTSEPIVDLFAAETSALLSWTDYLLGSRLDVVSPLIRPRIVREIQSRILTPCLDRDDFWWMGFSPRRVNNWNPWINSNWLTTALLMEADPARRGEAVSKSLRSIDRFLGPYPRDGGCDEGPGYWGRAGASLLDCLELLYSASDGKIDVYGEPLVQDIGRFIYRVQIEGDLFVNFADASAVVMPPPAVVFSYGKRIGDEDMMALGAWIAQKLDLRQERSATIQRGKRMSLGRLLPTLFWLDEIAAVEPRQPLPRDVWLDEIEVAAARDRAGTSEGLYLAAKGGHNAESHNHNDVGNWILYVDGKPLIVDAGVETYTRKTFSPQRYEIWTMQSGYHSLLPTIDGVMQAPGKRFAARNAGHQANDAQATFTLDIAAAYPPEAKIARWEREVTLVRGKRVTVADSYALKAPAQEIVLSLLTPSTVDLSQEGIIRLSEASLPGDKRSGDGQIVYDVSRFAVTTEAVPITDTRLGGVWGKSLNRIVFTACEPALEDSWTFEFRKTK